MEPFIIKTCINSKGILNDLLLLHTCINHVKELKSLIFYHMKWASHTMQQLGLRCSLNKEPLKGQNVFSAGHFLHRIALITCCISRFGSSPAALCLAVPRLPSVPAVILLSLEPLLLSPSAPVNSRPGKLISCVVRCCVHQKKRDNLENASPSHSSIQRCRSE